MSAPLGLGPALAIDAVFVLSVKTFTDRIAHVTRGLGRFGIPFEFVLEFDAAELDEATILRHFAALSPMKKQMSLTLKHLHAWRLAFHHPATGEWVEFAASLPDEFARLVAARRD